MRSGLEKVNETKKGEMEWKCFISFSSVFLLFFLSLTPPPLYPYVGMQRFFEDRTHTTNDHSLGVTSRVSK